MLCESLRRQVFPSAAGEPPPSAATLRMLQRHLADHDLWGRVAPPVRDVELRLPPLLGADVDAHFRRVASRQAAPYTTLADRVAAASLPRRPRRWTRRAGWTKYDATSKRSTAVDFPDDDGIVFDVEVLMTEGGQFPTLAVAASPTAWWVRSPPGGATQFR